MQFTTLLKGLIGLKAKPGAHAKRGNGRPDPKPVNPLRPTMQQMKSMVTTELRDVLEDGDEEHLRYVSEIFGYLAGVDWYKEHSLHSYEKGEALRLGQLADAAIAHAEIAKTEHGYSIATFTPTRIKTIAASLSATETDLKRALIGARTTMTQRKNLIVLVEKGSKHHE